MTPEEKQVFLADVHVGVVSVADGDRGPLTVPIWYDYEPGGDVIFITGRNSRKGRLMAKAGRMSLVAQTETAPYKYVTVEGPCTLKSADRERDLRPMARRYLGEKGGDAYIATMAGGDGADSVLVRLRPEHWLSVDYSE